MTDPRIRTIRFWMLAVGAVVVTLVWPALGLALFSGFAWAPLGLFMPVFAGVCDNCTGTYPDEIQVTFFDVANSACGTCTDINATWTLTQLGGTLPAACCFTLTDAAIPSCAGSTREMFACYKGVDTTPNSPVEGMLGVSNRLDAAIFGATSFNTAYATTPSYPVDCQDTHSSIPCVHACSGPQCDQTAATVTFDPLPP